MRLWRRGDWRFLFLPLLQVAVAVLVVAAPARSQTLDRFGGRADIKCAAKPAGWHPEKLGNRWWICTPAGHGIFLQDVELITATDDVANKKILSKYGNVYAWSDATLQRMRAWGFNAIGSYAYLIVLPGATDSTGHPAHSIELPFMGQVRPSFYSMRNPAIHTRMDADVRFLTEPVKDIFGAQSPFYRDYAPPGGVGDYYDPGMRTWLAKDMSQDFVWDNMAGTSAGDFLMGVIGDDSDEMLGFMSGPEFPTSPPGKNNLYLPLLILSDSPVQTANASFGFLYHDRTMYAKKALHDTLEAEYKSVAALNAAWGSNYSGFDSSGTPVAAENVAAGDGATLAFRHVLNELRPSRYSVQISVNGVPVGGDTGEGEIYGPTLTGTINYETGLLLLVFRPGHAPARESSLSVSYVRNGWGIGTGLMDEDMRPDHRAWLGNSWNGLDPIGGSALRKPNPRVKQDLDAFLKQTAAWYFTMLRDEIHARFPKTMVIAELGSWDGVPPAPVLQAAGESLDLFEDDESKGSFDQARLDFIAKNYGDRPFMSGIYLAATPDSDLRKNGDVPEGQFATQEAKGNAYLSAVSSFLKSKNSLGVNPHVGFLLWSWMDMWSEGTNWGLVSHLDNAYDGHEDVSATVPCSPPLQRYTCGGEPGNYGNYIGRVKAANDLWLAIPLGK